MQNTPPHLQPGRYDVSQKLYRRAQSLIPGGVNSPVRSFNSVGGSPVYFAGGFGAVVQDMDENQYIDYVLSWGPMILGHANEKIVKAVQETAALGTSFGAPTDRETYLADLVQDRHASIEQTRLVNSGTEATMSAIRLARGISGKNRIIKCEGCYHGHADSLLVDAGSGLLAQEGVASSAGVPETLASLTTVIPFNDENALKNAFMTYDDIACVIVEPVAGNMGCIPPKEGYLNKIEELCKASGALFILDEVMTGFRLGYSSAQGLYGVEPDITCFGKVIGGGLPLAAYAGKKDIMQNLAPTGRVYQAGTLSGNPIAVAAGCAQIEQLTKETYTKLEHTGSTLENGFLDVFAKNNIEASINRVGSMISVFFTNKKPENLVDVKASDTNKFNKFFHGMLEEGIYLPPSAYETWFLSTEHSDEFIEMTLKAADAVCKKL